MKFGTDACNYLSEKQLLSENKGKYSRDKGKRKETDIYGYQGARKIGESMEQ